MSGELNNSVIVLEFQHTHSYYEETFTIALIGSWFCKL